jgi:hypothetical protein
MARYFFNLYNDEITIDEEGTELSDDGAARKWAIEAVRAQAAHSVQDHSHLIRSHRLVILDETRAEIDTVTFGDVVSVRD